MDEGTYESLTEKGWVGLEEAAQLLGLSHANYVRQLIRNGKLGPAQKVREPTRNRWKWLVSPEAIANFSGRQRSGRKKYFLYLNTDNNEAAFNLVKEFLSVQFLGGQFEFFAATDHEPKPRKPKATKNELNEVDYQQNPTVDF